MNPTTPNLMLRAAAWLLGAVALGWSGALRGAKPPLPQVVRFALVAVLLVAFHKGKTFRTWVLAQPWQAWLALHLTGSSATGRTPRATPP